MNNKENFERAVNKKGKFAKFAYDHNIGMYIFNKKDRSYWLGKESHYDVENFFYISDIPELGGQTAAFQLRVSNHPTKHEQWENSHCNGAAQADFCLNLIIGGRGVDQYIENPSKTIKMGSIDCYNFNYYNRPPEEQAEIDGIISQITSGQQPTIPYSKIVSLFGGGAMKVTPNDKELEFRGLNFGKRKNLIPKNMVPFGYTENKPKTDKPAAAKNTGPGQIRTYIDSAELPGTLKDGDVITLDGRKYKYDDGNFVFYPERIRRGTSTFDVQTPIEIRESRKKRVITLNEGAIRAIIRDVLTRIM